jgi:hypothetical protein
MTTKPNPVNRKPIDRFTLAHAAVGLLLGLGRVKAPAVAALAVGWELVENPLKDRYPQVFPHPSHDTAANATCDALAVLAGWALGRYALTPPAER